MHLADPFFLFPPKKIYNVVTSACRMFKTGRTVKLMKVLCGGKQSLHIG